MIREINQKKNYYEIRPTNTFVIAKFLFEALPVEIFPTTKEELDKNKSIDENSFFDSLQNWIHTIEIFLHLQLTAFAHRSFYSITIRLLIISQFRFILIHLTTQLRVNFCRIM